MKAFFFLLFSLGIGITSSQAATYTAASNAETDIASAVARAADGDTVEIPCSGAATVTWTSTLQINHSITLTALGATPNTTPGTFGAGKNCLTIIDNVTNSHAGLIHFTVTSLTQAATVQNINIDPVSANTSVGIPIQLEGTCTASGCPNVRVDNIAFGVNTGWTYSNISWLITSDGTFGVLDHNTETSKDNTQFFNPNHSAYLGVGANGDNSWATPDSFGTANNMFVENNSIYVGFDTNVTDCEISPSDGAVGGCRQVDRFNLVTEYNGVSVFGVHGLETDGRPQGGREMEVYGNTVNCIYQSCNILAGFRSGTGFVFGNTMNNASGSWFNQIAYLAVYRNVYTATSGWGGCYGNGPYDTNDGVIYYSGTNAGPNGSTTLTDPNQNWTNNQLAAPGAPYSVWNVTQGWGTEVASNTATTITPQPATVHQANLFNNGDRYQIMRATVCADQGGRGQGKYVSGTPPTPTGSLNQVLDPIYEWNDTVQHLDNGNVASSTGRLIANRDWYTDGSNGSPQPQTSPTSPFNGSNGVGFGTLANRPPTCTTGVGYYATDQGSWNKSGNSFGQGQLFVCASTNTWTLHYTPYSYPHPLTTSASVIPPPVPGAPTNLTGNVH